MTWHNPKFSRTQVTKAGKFLRTDLGDVSDEVFEQWVNSFMIMANWRSCHGYPLNTFQATLRSKANKIDRYAIIAQRLKREVSILSKLERFPKMDLARMQDIGGVRAVLGTMGQVRKLETAYEESRLKHKLIKIDDYITNPKVSGYRSLHLVYKYKAGSETAKPYEGLLIEIQIRTRLQHAWATAVETMGTFLKHSLKSSEGPDEWLKYFALVGSAFAHLEKCTPVKQFENLTELQTYRLVRKESKKINVKNKLSAFKVVVEKSSEFEQKHKYYLVILDLENRVVRFKFYGRRSLDEANNEYARIESQIRENNSKAEVVLVSAGSMADFRKAFPNYLLDTSEFIKNLEKIIKKVE